MMGKILEAFLVGAGLGCITALTIILGVMAERRPLSWIVILLLGMVVLYLIRRK